ncbi:hypothetical protein KR222_006323 [Zaprionus bogoriensis]|nr:hypothetical protein KR222_006323 [Zaprionus bogoriensis]
MHNDWPVDDDDDFDQAFNELLDAPQQQQKQEQPPQQQPQRQEAHSDYDGFDAEAGHNWLYPSNLPLRSYQHSIVQAALFRNTLVVLPTGLGKTFIASVVMYNLHRWYPQGKLIFMAPTRPLVSQQIAACQKIMPFPADDTVELTGRLPRVKRAELWRSKRVFFATPQVVQSDMMAVDPTDGSGLQQPPFPYEAIKLLVVDEAHRAKGRYAYTQVTESIMARNRNFRVLALSATPGRSMDDVLSVCRNLYISHVEVRCDNSIDVQPYVHQRSLRTIVVQLEERIKEPRARLLQIIDPYLRQLCSADVLRGARGNISRNNLLFDQQRYQQQAAQGQRHPEHSLITGNFSMCISLYHALELLERHGLRVFVNSFEADERGRDRFVLRDAALRDLIEQARHELGANPLELSTRTMTNGQVAPMPGNLDFGHPKYEQARQVLLQHFESHADSRAIVFCEYRESVMLIQRLLLQHRPLLRSRCFVGQSSNGGGICALTQKEQLQIMADFRSGAINVLVATSIGEEGLDVGEVELIVCFDICSSNPTRFVQRIGRTGRQKRGAVVMLVTEGREQQMLKEVLAQKDQLNRKLLSSSALLKRALYEHSPRLVPPQFNPKCEQRHMESTAVRQTPTPKSKSKGKSKDKEKAVSSVRSHDLRNFFKQTQDKFLEEAPAYKASAATQQLLQQQVARRSVPNFLLDTQPTSSCSQEEEQRLRKLTRLLQSSRPLISDSQRNQELLAQLQDKQLPVGLKRFLLQSDRGFVREIHAKMQQQKQLQLPEARLNTRQQRTRRHYELLQDICGGQLDELLQPVEPESEHAESSLAELLLLPQHVQRQQQFDAVCGQIFRDLPEGGLCTDNYELVQQQLEQLELQHLEQTMQEQLGNESSGYFEQWDEPEEPTLPLQQSQWQDSVPHSSTPVRSAKSLEHSSRVECSQLSVNLSRLNCIMSAASTPVPDKKLRENSLLTALDEDLSAFDQLQELQPVQPEATQQADVTTLSAVASTPDALEQALELDLNDFLEPLPEEQQLLQLSGAKENNPPGTPRNLSPDIFAEDSMSPWRPAAATTTTTTAAAAAALPAKTLAAKLAAKTRLGSPDGRQRTAPLNAEKSPSIFDNYLQRMRGRGQLSRAAQRLNQNPSHNQNENQQEQEPDDSPIVRRRSGKRKIIEISDDDEEEEQEEEEVAIPDTQLPLEEDDDSYEQVPATQLPEASTPPHRKSRQKRARHNSFILHEVEMSGSEHEEDAEAERTIGCYLKDSVIVSSDEGEAHDDTNMHAMYLQAVRSPLQRPGAFKLPAPRVYDDESIYSQPVEAEPSQYYPCSFIANDESTANEQHDISECPLERAERILKERRRQRRRAAAPIATVVNRGKRRRIQTLQDSSDDDDDDDDVILVR